MNRGQKKTRNNASAWAGQPLIRVLRHQRFCCRFTSACQQVFWMQRRKMCGILAHMPCGGDALAVFDVEDVSHGRDPRPACRLRTPAPRHSIHLGLYLSVNTRQPKAVRPRVAGANNCNWTAPGIAVDRTPDVDKPRAKENPQQCVCKSGLAPYGSC